MKKFIAKPYDCRPLAVLELKSTKEWTVEEMSAFAKFRGSERTTFIKEWESVCNRLNPTRVPMNV